MNTKRKPAQRGEARERDPYEAGTVPDEHTPADIDEIGFDDGQRSEVDFSKPAPRDEGDNPAEQAAARKRSRRSLPPRARPRER